MTKSKTKKIIEQQKTVTQVFQPLLLKSSLNRSAPPDDASSEDVSEKSKLSYQALVNFVGRADGATVFQCYFQAKQEFEDVELFKLSSQYLLSVDDDFNENDVNEKETILKIAGINAWGVFRSYYSIVAAQCLLDLPQLPYSVPADWIEDD